MRTLVTLQYLCYHQNWCLCISQTNTVHGTNDVMSASSRALTLISPVLRLTPHCDNTVPWTPISRCDARDKWNGGQVERERETGKQRQRQRKGGGSTFTKPVNDTPFEVGPRIRD